MYKETLECKLIQVIREYGIVRCTERNLIGAEMKPGRRYVVYDVCLDHGEGDIVYSCKSLNEARKWAKEN